MISGPLQQGASGLRGYLYLTCGLDSRGISTLRRQAFRAPFHLSKPHLDPGGTLVVNIANPTAGLLAGDRTECQVEVETGARLCLTAPGANRAHHMRGSAAAEARQSFHVASGGWLEFLPELFIPQAGSRYRQRTNLHVEPGGELLYIESLAPGRTARGEVLQYSSLHFDLRATVGETCVAQERYTLEPGGLALAALQDSFAAPYYASCYLLSTRLTGQEACWQRLHALHTPEAWIGCTRLASAGWLVKVLAAGSIPLRAALHTIRAELHSALGYAMPDLRRTTPIG